MTPWLSISSLIPTFITQNIIKIIIWHTQACSLSCMDCFILKLAKINHIISDTLLEIFSCIETANIAYSLWQSSVYIRYDSYVLYTYTFNICSRYSCWTKHMIRIEHCWLKIIYKCIVASFKSSRLWYKCTFKTEHCWTLILLQCYALPMIKL